MRRGKNLAGGLIEGNTRGPRGPKNTVNEKVLKYSDGGSYLLAMIRHLIVVIKTHFDPVYHQAWWTSPGRGGSAQTGSTVDTRAYNCQPATPSEYLFMKMSLDGIVQ